MRLIDADEVQTRIDMVGTVNGILCWDAHDFIDRIPTIDAKVIQHGKWIQCSQPDIDYNIVAQCSICGAQQEMCDAALDTGEVRWCWKCGARMDEGDDNA